MNPMTIERCENGWIIEQMVSDAQGGGPVGLQRYAFESIQSLQKALPELLGKPPTAIPANPSGLRCRDCGNVFTKPEEMNFINQHACCLNCYAKKYDLVGQVAFRPDTSINSKPQKT